jgi:hypothetical protein
MTVGLCCVIAAKRLGAEQIIILGRRADRIALAREFGGVDVVSERGDEASACASSPAALAFTLSSNVGLEQSMRTAISIARPGGAVGRVGVLQGDESRSTAGSITALGGKAVSETN